MLQVERSYLAINISWLIVTLLMFLILIKLGLWQNQRANEKDERLARIERLVSEQAIPVTNITGLTSTLALADGINDLPVVVSGVFDSSWLFLLDNQMLNGRFGYRVFQWVDLTPQQTVLEQRLENKSSTVNNKKNQKILINLGWHLADRTRRTQPNIQPLTGNVHVKGHIRIVEQGITLASEPLRLNKATLNDEVLNNETKTMLIQRIDLAKIAELIGAELLPFVVYVDKGEALGYQKNWQPIVMPPEKHRGYAFQWFSLAAAWLLLMIFAARKSALDSKLELVNQSE